MTFGQMLFFHWEITTILKEKTSRIKMTAQPLTHNDKSGIGNKPKCYRHCEKAGINTRRQRKHANIWTV